MEPKTPPDAKYSMTANKPLLLVEDHQINREMCVAMLRSLGYATEVANDGRAGAEAAIQNTYAAILMDCQMPVMDGFTATVLIRAHEKTTNETLLAAGRPEQRVPIIALTANVMRGYRERCYAAGMDDYLAKPFRTHELQAIIERWTGPRS
jgi:CheY-like chemotaxis protein